MDESVLREEQAYLDETLAFLGSELSEELKILTGKRQDLKEMHREMWSNYVSHSLDDDKLKDITQLFTQYNQTAHAADSASRVAAKYERLLKSPYFGRFDIVEEGMRSADKIYVGFHNLFDLKGGQVYIYDWRSPIASVYYRFELGSCHYDAPDGKICGEVELKRQIKVDRSEVKYFADSGIVIRDEILLEALSQNATPKMKTIVETIQKEQDLIIRDLTNDVLIVNGVAGSGKTSIALHRIAYLLYESKLTKAARNNMLVLSPSDVFADYIDEVLPNLGEERVSQLTMDDIYSKFIKKISIQTKYQYLESIMRSDVVRQYRRRRAFAFKSSAIFAEILDRYALMYERRLHSFSDIVLDNKTLFSGGQLKALFLDNKAKLSVAARLRRIYDRVCSEAESHFDTIREKIKKIVYAGERHAFEENKYIERHLEYVKNRFYRTLRRQLSFNPVRVYISLITDKDLFYRAASGIILPDDAFSLANRGSETIIRGFLPYDDAGAVLYLTELLCGIKDFACLRHVVIDEAQDYSVINYLSFKRLFPNAKYTILGDTYQTIGKKASPGFFRRVSAKMKNPRTASLSLNKSYRSSMEIYSFCNSILGRADTESFCRSGEPPEIHVGSAGSLLTTLTASLNSYESGRSIAVLTKTMAGAKVLYDLLDVPGKSLLNDKNEKLSRRLNIMPAYMAKGLEFDFVAVWGADGKNYNTALDKNLLYVACTRALHKLEIYAEGSLTPFISVDC